MPSFVINLLIWVGVLAVACLIVGATSVRVLAEYERGVVFRLGRLLGTRGPGLVFVLPRMDRLMRVDLRPVTAHVPPIDALTRDRRQIKAGAVVRYKVVHPELVVTMVVGYPAETLLVAETALLREVADVNLDTVLHDQTSLNRRLREVVAEQTAAWGVEVELVELERVEVVSSGLEE